MIDSHRLKVAQIASLLYENCENGATVLCDYDAVPQAIIATGDEDDLGWEYIPDRIRCKHARYVSSFTNLIGIIPDPTVFQYYLDAVSGLGIQSHYVPLVWGVWEDPDTLVTEVAVCGTHNDPKWFATDANFNGQKYAYDLKDRKLVEIPR